MSKWTSVSWSTAANSWYDGCIWFVAIFFFFSLRATVMNCLSYIQQTWDFSFSTWTLIMSLFLNHHHSWGNTVKAVLSASSDVSSFTSYADVLLHFWFSSADSTRTLSPSTPWSTSKWRNREPSVSRFQVAIRTLSIYSHLDSYFEVKLTNAHCHDSYSKGGHKVHLWYCTQRSWGIQFGELG